MELALLVGKDQAMARLVVIMEEAFQQEVRVQVLEVQAATDLQLAKDKVLDKLLQVMEHRLLEQELEQE